MLLHDLTLLAWIYFILLLLQLMALPIIFYLSKKFTYLKDAGWGFGRILSILILSLLIWHLAFCKIPVNTNFAVNAVFVCLSLLSLFFSWTFFLSKRNFLKEFVKKFGRIILIEEIVFLLGLIFMFIIRSFQPDILDLEKFMDAGFIQAYLKSPTLPAGDMWLANESINYYTFGHFYHAILVHLWQVDLAYGYNLLLISLFAIFCLELFSIAFNFKANLSFGSKSFSKGRDYNFKAALFAGIFAIFLVALGANGHPLWYFVTHGNFDAYWYPDATRFIDRTIHEFPAYSFVVCDLHGHVLALPISLLLLLTIFMWLKELVTVRHLKLATFLKTKLFPLALLMGSLFGVLVMTNTWDTMIYGLFLSLVSLLVLSKNKTTWLPIVLSAVCVFLGTAVLSAFWLLNFTSIANGLALANEHTPLWQLLVLWGPHLLFASVLLIVVRPLFLAKKSDQTLLYLIRSLFLMVLFLIAFPEFFYFKDIYTTYPRANTMFKFVFQGFILLGILLSLCFSSLLFEKNPKKQSFSWRLIDLRQSFPRKKKRLSLWKIRWRKFFLLYLPIATFLFFSTLAYPYLAFKSYYGGLKVYKGLDGLAWFKKKYPQDYVLMEYLRKNEAKQVNIVEAVGESYTEFARVSAFSGMPTILGWRVHEWLWRASWDEPAKRTGEVEKIYLEPTSAEARGYLDQYQIKYIVLGDKEREAYPELDVEGLLSLGTVVVSQGNHYLIQLF